MKNVVLAMVVMALSACTATAPVTPDEGPRALPFGELARGNNSHQTERRHMLITDQATLLAVWRDLDGRMPPSIDFERQAVLAVFMGQRRTGGYSIRVDEVVRDGDVLKVGVETRSPGADCITTQALTEPYHLVVIPSGAVRAEFQSRNVVVSCR